MSEATLASERRMAEAGLAVAEALMSHELTDAEYIAVLTDHIRRRAGACIKTERAEDGADDGEP